jgi:hypothetical protein
MANRIWKPAAADVSDIWKIAVGGTWANTETLTLTVAGQDLIITLGSSGLTTANIANKIYLAVNATDYKEPLLDNESRNTGGQAIPQMSELTATWVSASSDVYLFGPAGVPVTVSVAETSTSGTLTLTHPQTATGKHFWNNTDNWSGGSIPADGDDVWFMDSAVHCWFGLPAGTLTLASLHVMQSFERGQLGLPPVNRFNPAKPYPEYRARFIVLDDTAPQTSVFTIGEGVGLGPSLANIDNTGGTGAYLNLLNTGPRLAPDQYVANYKPAATSGNRLSVNRGSVAVGTEAGDAGELDTVYIADNVDNPPDVWIGEGVTNNDVAITQYGGRLRTEIGPNSHKLYGGEGINNYGFQGTSSLWVFGDAVCRITALTGGNLLDSVKISGTLDLTDLVNTGTINKCDVFRGFRILDPGRLVTWTNGIQCQGCTPNDGLLEICHVKLTPAAIA